MLKFTHGAPDEMQVWIACGIAAYLMVFPFVVVIAAVCGEVMRRAESGEPAAAAGAAHAPGPVHQRVAAPPPAASREVGVGTAA